MIGMIIDSIKKTERHHLRQAKILAETSKRIDICASQISHQLHSAGVKTLEGKVCLEIGSGLVLSHAIILYLLGAKKIVTTDLNCLARPEVIKHALKNSIHSLPRDVLSSFSDPCDIRMRYKKLQSINVFSIETLEKEFNIFYHAPVDLRSDSSVFEDKFDFIYSISVLEHIPSIQITLVLEALSSLLDKDGFMLHNIHLEDHADLLNNPFEFLSSNLKYSVLDESARGNRVRFSKWMEHFSNLKKYNIQTDCFYKYYRKDKNIPNTIDPVIEYDDDDDDLRVSHIGVVLKKYNA